MPKPRHHRIECPCTQEEREYAKYKGKLRQTPCCNLNCENNKVEISRDDWIEFYYERYVEGMLSEERLNELIIKL